eukprot:GHVH01013439.1.p1 GENE.GHVH01013439.1~~GHVH01013439.1.p1  ORF type:complete len:133 (-),score=13.85 GHVH01013439.1:14-412(-)
MESVLGVPLQGAVDLMRWTYRLMMREQSAMDPESKAQIVVREQSDRGTKIWVSHGSRVTDRGTKIWALPQKKRSRLDAQILGNEGDLGGFFSEREVVHERSVSIYTPPFPFLCRILKYQKYRSGSATISIEV